jgi:hypothetical protein
MFILTESVFNTFDILGYYDAVFSHSKPDKNRPKKNKVHSTDIVLHTLSSLNSFATKRVRQTDILFFFFKLKYIYIY